MQSYREHIIQELPLSSSYFRQKVERFLGENGLRLEELDVYCAIENQAIFESLGFHVLATAPKAILMENGRGLEKYCEYLRTFRREGHLLIDLLIVRVL